MYCRLYFNAHGGIDEASKLTRFMTFLTNKPLTWATAMQGENDTSNYDQFVSLFQRVFVHFLDGKEVSDKLLSLSHSRCAAKYAIDFSTLAAESGWNDSAPRAVYLNGLNDELMKELACREESMSLDKLISYSIKLISL